MKKTYNLQSVVNLLLENEVGFELFYGENDSTREISTRAALLVDMAPAVRIDFGDNKNGTLVSRVHIANNHKINIRVEDFVEQVKVHKTIKPWNTAATVTKRSESFETAGLKAGVGTGTTAITGTLEGDVTLTADSEGFWVNFSLKTRNFVQALSTREVVEVDPTVIDVVYLHKNFSQAKLTAKYVREAAKSYVEGEYIYPRKIVATTLGAAE